MKNSDENLDSIEPQSCLAFYPRPVCIQMIVITYFVCVCVFFCTLGPFDGEKTNYYIAVRVNKFICTQHTITFECFLFFCCCDFHPLSLYMNGTKYMYALGVKKKNWDNCEWKCLFYTKNDVCLISSQSINIKCHTPIALWYTPFV